MFGLFSQIVNFFLDGKYSKRASGFDMGPSGVAVPGAVPGASMLIMFNEKFRIA